MSRFPSPVRRTLRTLMTTTALTSTALLVAGALQTALAQSSLPTGGTVAAGSVSIHQTAPGSMVINQTSGTAITNWQSFSIGAGNSVAVVQPSASAGMLARVTGNTTSTIAGSLTATGQLMLVNPNGIAITPTGTVNAGGGFVATTLGITDQDYLAGIWKFTGNGASNAVSNAGAISVGPGGYAALIGGTVANSGTIAVPLGKVAVGSGEVATLDFSGDGFLQVGVPTTATGSGALVEQSGKITANGGQVEIKAAAARDAARLAVNMSGVVAARGVSGHDGDITLDGGDGAVAVSGKLTTASRRGQGGTIAVTGGSIALTGARLNASGKTGGGTVKIGGDWHGGGTLKQAATTTIDSTTTIKADATGSGDGGTVVVWSDSTTSFAGTISAKGGPNGGNGGSAEVSSHGVLAYSGTTILTAPHGATGTLLLDPENVTISNGADTGGFTAASDDSVINVTTLQNALATANVTVSTGASGAQAGNITVANAVTWTAGTTLELDAANNIAVNAPISFGGTSGAGLALNASNALAINAPIQVNGVGDVTLNYNAASPTNLSFGLTGSGFAGSLTYANADGTAATSSQGGTLTINGSGYNLIYSMNDLAGINASSTTLGGNYALAHALDASSTTGWTPLGTDGNSNLLNSGNGFAGTFDGLGHTVANLTVNLPSATYVGLFGYSAGTLRNIGLVGGSVSGLGVVGELAGDNTGMVASSYATGTVTGGAGGSVIGGLVGSNNGTVTLSYATSAVTAGANGGDVGGLVGANGSIVSSSYATGAVTGGGYTNDIGGLVGYNPGGTVTSSYATGAATGSTDPAAGSVFVGGLVGLSSGTVTSSYATGAATGGGGVGGLVGQNSGSVSTSYATGAATGQGGTGGLVGQNTGSVSTSYATGAVTGSGLIGGLVGQNAFGSVSMSYATGAVTGSGLIGGLVGRNFSATVSSSYWDTQTSGQTVAFGSDNNNQTATGLTTSQLQDGSSASGLGAAFTVPSGLYPYLTSFFPGGVQAISGIAYQGVGGTPAASGANGAVTVTGFANGTTFGTATTGANGYYYIFGPAGSFASGNSLVTYTSANSTTGTTNSATLATATGAANQSGVNLYGNTDTLSTAATTLSTAPTVSAIAAATGNDPAATAAINAATGRGFIATGASFTIDQTVDTASTFFVQTTSANAPIIVAKPITIDGGGLGLFSSGAIDINAPIQVNGAGDVTLTYNAASPANLSFGLTGSGFTGALTYANADGSTATSSQGGTLSINGSAYNLIYSMSDLAGINASSTTLGGNYALAHALDASSTTGWTPLGTDGNSNPLNSAKGFAGTFDGLGHTVANLTVNLPSATYVGLFGVSWGTLRNIGVVGGSVSGLSDVGELVGVSRGMVASSYATGTVTGKAGGFDIGGLVGASIGTVTLSYATGAVTAEANGFDVGGLVGANGATVSSSYATGAVAGGGSIGGLVGYNFGTVTSSYATGAATGGNDIGGLVGINRGTVTSSYATGAVTGGSIGGLAGYNSGTVTSSYWDEQTTGQAVAFGYDYNNQTVAGLTTAQFQDGASASGLGSAFTVSSGLYPYLTSFFPSGVQAVSGFAYQDGGATVLASSANGAGLVNVRAGNGATLTVTTGANGYYYAFFANGAIDAVNGTGVLAYTVANGATGTQNGATLTTKATGSLTGINVYGNTLTETADAGVGSLSALNTAYATIATGTSASGLTFANRTIAAAARAFTIDQSVSNAGAVSIASAGDITIAPGATVTGGSVKLVAPGAFINNEGADAVSATVGSWLIYSANPSGDTFGGLDSGNTAIWNTAAGGAVTATGNRYVFAYQPTLTVTTAGDSKSYGNDATSAVADDYVVTGYQTGVAGAYRGDTAATAYSGTAAVTSAGAELTAGVHSGGYAYSLGLGSLASSSGYAFTLANTGTFTVNPRAITVTANAQTQVYGNAVPTLTYAVGGLGLANGDALSGALVTTATATSGVGTYGITQGTVTNANNGNYAITYAGAHDVITPRAITVTANAQTQVYGNATLALTYTVGGQGFVNGDTLSGGLATAATAASNVGSYAITQGTLAASANYAVTYTAASDVITARPITVTANAQSQVYGNAVPTLSYTVGGLGLVNGEALSGTLATTATAQSNVGTYGITQGTVTNANNGNYSITYGGANDVIVPRAITVTANSQSRFAGTANPALTYAIGGLGLVNGDALSGELATTATTTSPVGSYAITQGTLAASRNYALTFQSALLTVNPNAPPSTDFGNSYGGFTGIAAWSPVPAPNPTDSGAFNGFSSPGYDRPSLCAPSHTCASP